MLRGSLTLLVAMIAFPSSATASNCFDHYNPKSWDGKGTAIVFCRNHSDSSKSSFISSCELRRQGGAKIQNLTRHGSLDKGRVLYTDYNTPGSQFNFAIDIVCQTKGGETLKYSFGSGANAYNGCCRNKDCGSTSCCGTGCSSTSDSDPDPDPPPNVSDAAAQACKGIIANSSYELCGGSATTCKGVFTDGSGCNAYCRAAGMICVAQHGGGEGCIKESSSFACGTNTGHMSDWCECAVEAPPEPEPEPDPKPEPLPPTPDAGVPTSDSWDKDDNVAPAPDLATFAVDRGVERPQHMAAEEGMAGACSVGGASLEGYSSTLALLLLCLAVRRRRALR